MPPTQQPSDIEQSVTQVMQMLPPPVRNYLASGKYTIVAKGLTAKHELHLDQGGILEREIMLLLMGIENPSEFMATLTGEARIPEPVVKEIMMEINQGIFMPLQEEMRKGVETLGKKPPQIPSVMPVQQPAVASVMSRPIPPAPAAGAGQPTSHFHLENKLPAPPRPAESVAVRPIPPRPSAQVPVAAAALRTPVPALPQHPPRPAVASGVGGLKPIPVQLPVAAQPAPFSQPPRSMSAEPIPPRPLQSVTPITKADASVGSPTVFASGPKSVNILSIAPLPPKIVLPRAVGAGLRSGTQPFPKSTDSSKLLEDHEEPHIDISNKVQAASSETPLQQALRTVLPPPPNLPGAMPPPDITPSSRPAPVAPKAFQAPVKPYSADPYREPID